MTKNEKLARKNIQNCINFELGGWENVLLDYPEDAEEYINAKDFLADHEAKEKLMEIVEELVSKEGY